MTIATFNYGRGKLNNRAITSRGGVLNSRGIRTFRALSRVRNMLRPGQWNSARTATRVGKNSGQTKRKFHQAAKGNGIGGYISSYNHFGPNKLDGVLTTLIKKNDLAHSYAISSTSGLLEGLVGRQAVVTCGYMYPVQDLVQLQSQTSMTLLATQTMTSIHLKCVAALDLINVGNTTCKVVLYDLVARKDLVNEGVAAMEVGNPTDAWTQGMLKQGLGVGPTVNDLGVLPYQTRPFTQNWKICKVTHVVMAAGQVHQHKLTKRAFRKINASYIDKPSLQACKGLTCATMMVINGFPESDSTIDAQVTSGQCRINFLFKKQYAFTHLQDSETSSYKMLQVVPTAYTNSEDVKDLFNNAITGFAEP